MCMKELNTEYWSRLEVLGKYLGKNDKSDSVGPYFYMVWQPGSKAIGPT